MYFFTTVFMVAYVNLILKKMMMMMSFFFIGTVFLQ